MNITICGKKELKDVLSRDKYDNIISINDPDNETVWDMHRRNKWKMLLLKHAKNVLCLYFDDITPNHPIIYNTRIVSKLPLDSHIRQIIQFAKGIKGKTLIHCVMG